MISERNPAVTVIMPVFNGGANLQLAVNSVLAQSFTDFELLVIDDGSGDGSIELLNNLQDARLKVVRQNHAGLVAALNNGVQLARGRYIARHDHDDVSFPERLAKQVAFLEANPRVDLVGTRAIVFKDNADVVGLLPFAATHQELTARLWRGIPLPHPTWMGRRSWFSQYRYRVPEVLRAEDQELLLRASFTSCYACLDDVLIGYRQGNFKLRRTLATRRSILAMQIGIFLSRGRWLDIARCIAMIMLKALVDLLTALPGAESLWFRRMSYPAQAEDVAKLNQLLLAGNFSASQTKNE